MFFPQINPCLAQQSPSDVQSSPKLWHLGFSTGLVSTGLDLTGLASAGLAPTLLGADGTADAEMPDI